MTPYSTTLHVTTLYFKVVKHLDTWYDKNTLSMEKSS